MTTLAATALRLAAREVLAPYAAIQAGSGFPTIAQGRVYDSEVQYFDEIRNADAPLPAMSLYTPRTSGRARGGVQSAGTMDWEIDLVVTTMMAVMDDETDDEGVYAAQSSSEAEANLDLLGEQVRYALFGPHDYAHTFRTIAKHMVSVEQKSYYLPEMQLNIAQRDIVFSVLVDDLFQSDLGGLPAPIEAVRQWLPEGTDGRSYLDQIAAAMGPTNRTPLNEIMIGADFDGTMPEDFDDAQVKGRVDTNPPSVPQG